MPTKQAFAKKYGLVRTGRPVIISPRLKAFVTSREEITKLEIELSNDWGKRTDLRICC